MSFIPNSSFSQYGEDVLAMHALAACGIRSGYYIDIGCGDPVEYSNTHLFYLNSWRGILVDPNPEVSELVKLSRPEDLFVNAACSISADPLTYWRFDPYLYSTCDPQRASVLQSDCEVKFIEQVEVNSFSLFEIYQRLAAHVNSNNISLLSIDVEGLEMQVLESNNWQIFRPVFILLEILGLRVAGGLLKTPAYMFMNEHGYTLKGITQSTFLFGDTKSALLCSSGRLPLFSEGQ